MLQLKRLEDNMVLKKAERYIIATKDRTMYYCDGYILNKRRTTIKPNNAKIISTKNYAKKLCMLMQEQYPNKEWEVIEL